MLYSTSDGTNRLQAERNLAELAASPECLQTCTLLLQNGTVPYAQLVASSTLMKVLGSNTVVALHQRLELCTYLLNYLGERHSSLPQFVISQLCQLFARLTKLGWSDFVVETRAFPFRDPVHNILPEKEGILAVQLLAHLVADMNIVSGMDSVSKQRKTASNFRDSFLLIFFKLAISMLEKILDNDSKVISCLLQLSLNCLTFDFVGSMIDETGDDSVTVQVPTVWRIALTDCKVVDMFFRLFKVLPIELTSRVLLNLVQLASVRRSLFSSGERQTFLSELVRGVKGIMESPEKLRQQESFHEFCRLVSRLKINYQLSELLKVDDYSVMITMLADFTEQSLRAYEFSANSTYYLLAFWQKMVSSMPYVKGTDPHMLDLCCPKITRAFVESRLLFARAVVREDPLEDQGALHQVLEQFAIICRCDYDETAKLLLDHFDRAFNNLKGITSSGLNEAIAEMTWLLFLIGGAIQGRQAFSVFDDHDLIDGNFLALKALEVSDERLATGVPGNLHLEESFLYVLEQFRRTYVCEHIQKINVVYDVLEKNLGLQDENALLTIFVRKIITNLKFWWREERLIDATLALLNELSLGYSAARRIIRLQDIQLLLNNHTGEYFEFLSSIADLSAMRSRTTFYVSIMRLMCVDFNDDESTFLSFMQPLSDNVQQICDVFAMSSPTVDQEQVKCAVIGLCRDVRGIAIACHIKSVYSMLFDWLYPNVFNIMLRSVELWVDCSAVMSAVLKLLIELCQNRQQRLQFEMSSCSAVLLFREASKIICSFGERLLALPEVSPENAYKERYKHIASCFAALKMALSGSYVPFGVFRLYGDTCLQDALSMFMKLFMAIPTEEFHSYQKVTQNFYSLLECIAHDNIAYLSNVQPELFITLLRYIQRGTVSLDGLVVTASCATLDTLLNYLYRRISQDAPPRTHVGSEPEGEECIRALRANPTILLVMLDAIVFDDVKCQWSMSRPLLGLILLQESAFQQWKMDLLAQYPQEKHARFEKAFTDLMDGVGRNLYTRNKDTFTQNLVMFRRSASFTFCSKCF
ncbi:unnamed protein product [Enterobius vermicularis]|uniref:Importin N-terminal domain-containing protein n=1 Tax=Enterobius vermicularis TaxID=51028 RepID=A0A0N4V0R5_ENTVE|nr:unnamed protein product [Enterobius vermicularis]